MKIIAMLLVGLSLLMPMETVVEPVDIQEETGIVTEVTDCLIEVDIPNLIKPIGKLPIDKKPIVEPPVIDKPIFIGPIFSQPITAYNSHVIYANWTDDTEMKNGALNAGNTDKNSLAIYRLSSAADAAQFKARFGSLSYSAYDSLMSKLGDDFFASNSLMLVYVPANSGSTRFSVGYAGVSGDTFVVEIDVESSPEIGTCDMSGWFAIVEVPDEVLDSCTSFNAYRAGVLNKKPVIGIIKRPPVDKIEIPKIGKGDKTK